ncbi:hypothetical protein EIP86_005301 [Pleurotus ostreatoroseus]|nr:hypothetical protein EIP86_005301 [Pleurotus ostreatoroseus]
MEQSGMGVGQYGNVAKIAAEYTRSILCTAQAVESLKRATLRGLSPILFSAQLEKRGLDHLESVGLARAVMQQGHKQLLHKWLKESKPDKVIAYFAETGRTDKIVLYVKVGSNRGYIRLFRYMIRFKSVSWWTYNIFMSQNMDQPATSTTY